MRNAMGLTSGVVLGCGIGQVAHHSSLGLAIIAAGVWMWCITQVLVGKGPIQSSPSLVNDSKEKV